ncbi:MAG: multicopper oxidase domain-containing protein [Actinomycetota bacterium]
MLGGVLRRSPVRSALTVAVATLLLAGTACTSASKPVTLSVTLSEFKVAAPATAPANRPLQFNIKNAGSAAHVLSLVANGKTYATPEIGPGLSGKLAVPALPAGRYKLFCSLPGHREAGMETSLLVGSGVAAAASSMTSDEVDAAHEAGVNAFPAKTGVMGNQVLKPRIQNGRKIFDITPKAVRWEVSPGEFIDGYGYNGQIPGPQIHVKTGDKIRVVLHNELPESTTIHMHGIELPNAMDGVPYLTQPPVKPDESFNYEFTVADPPGTYMYHSHHNATFQVGRGLFGAMIVDEPKKTVDVDETIMMSDGDLGFLLNGKSFPATSPITSKLGQRVRIRLINAGQLMHPMHLHGIHFKVVAKDGRPLESPYLADTQAVAPGETWDVELTTSLTGKWAFHCHILPHAESEHGMHGMVTALIVS